MIAQLRATPPAASFLHPGRSARHRPAGRRHRPVLAGRSAHQPHSDQQLHPAVVAAAAAAGRTQWPPAARSATYVLWDLDNVLPLRPGATLLQAIQEVTAALHCRDAAVTLFANTRTCSMLGPQLCAALSAAGCELLEVHTKSQAADVQLTTRASEFATTHRRQGCLVVVTCDTGFAPLLAYCSSLGVRTVLVTAMVSPKTNPGALPDLTRHPLAAAADATLPWRPRAAAAGSSSSSERVPLPGQAQHWHRLQGRGESGGGGDAASAGDHTSARPACLEGWAFVNPLKQPAPPAGG